MYFIKVHFLHIQKQYKNNRITEEIRDEDRTKGGIELILQQVFQIIYGWQDRLMVRIDKWSARKEALITPAFESIEPAKCYEECIRNNCTSYFWITWFRYRIISADAVFVLNQVELYLYLNLFLMNGILIISIEYRRSFCPIGTLLRKISNVQHNGKWHDNLFSTNSQFSAVPVLNFIKSIMLLPSQALEQQMIY